MGKQFGKPDTLPPEKKPEVTVEVKEPVVEAEPVEVETPEEPMELDAGAFDPAEPAPVAVGSFDRLAEEIAGKKKKKQLHVIQKPEPCEFWGVIVQEPSNQYEAKSVPLSVDGRTLHLQRGKEVIIPSNFVRALNDACSKAFARDEKLHFRQVGWNREFHFSVTRRDYKEAEFLTQLNEGNAVQDAALQRNQNDNGLLQDALD